MESSNNIYKAVGKLFYAIAAVDNTIHPLELETIEKLIGKKRNTNEGSKEILESFYSMLKTKTPAYDAFKEFETYKQTHEQEFTPKIKKWIWQIADRITYSFSGKNKSEVIILSKLKNILQA